MEMVTTGNITALMKNATPILESVMEHTPEDGWEKHLPTWVGSVHTRGLLGWGQTRSKKTGQVLNKTWAIPKVQRAALTTAINAWIDFVGLPPTQAGR